MEEQFRVGVWHAAVIVAQPSLAGLCRPSRPDPALRAGLNSAAPGGAPNRNPFHPERSPPQALLTFVILREVPQELVTLSS